MKQCLLTRLFLNWLPMLLLLVFGFFLRQMQGNGGSLGFGRSKAKLLTEKHGKVFLGNVAGVDDQRGTRGSCSI